VFVINNHNFITYVSCYLLFVPYTVFTLRNEQYFKKIFMLNSARIQIFGLNLMLCRNSSLFITKLCSYLLTYLLAYRAESFLRSWHLCSLSGTSQHFIEPEGSLLSSQEPSTCPYPEPDQSSPYHPSLTKTHFNIVHPRTSWSS
jgi:hypothetical protein